MWALIWLGLDHQDRTVAFDTTALEAPFTAPIAREEVRTMRRGVPQVAQQSLAAMRREEPVSAVDRRKVLSLIAVIRSQLYPAKLRSPGS